MAYLSDYDKGTVFNDFTPVSVIERTLIKDDTDPVVIRLLIVPEKNDKVVRFFMSPKNEAFTFKDNFYLNNNSESFSIAVLGFMLPDSWSGDLNMAVDGFVKKIPLHFEKRSLLH